MENQIQSNTPPIKPVSQASISPSTNWQKVLIFVLLGLVVIAGSVFAGIQIGKNQISNQQPISIQPTATPTQTIVNPTIPKKSNSAYDVSLDMNTWFTFTSSNLGFSFKYPSEWGEVKEEVKNAATEGTGDAGKTYSLTFSKINYEAPDLNNLAFGSGRSSDYSASRGGMDTDYYGDSKQPKGVKATVWARPTSCIIPISSHLYFGRIDFNLPGKEISGVRLLMPVVSQNQVKIFDVEYNSMTTKQQQKYCTEESVEKEANKYITELETKQLDDLSKKQLSVFKQILSSAKVL